MTLGARCGTKPTSAASLLAVMVMALAGCSATSAPSTSPNPEPSPQKALSASELCRSVLQNQTLLAWVPATVANFHAYQYSGPKPHLPLRDAFPGASDATPGVWCGVKSGPESIAWWAVVEGRLPAHAITINGPGSDKYVGETTDSALVVP